MCKVRRPVAGVRSLVQGQDPSVAGEMFEHSVHLGSGQSSRYAPDNGKREIDPRRGVDCVEAGQYCGEWTIVNVVWD